MQELIIGNEVDVADNRGRTALHYASWNGKIEAVKWLLDKGASLSEADAKKDSALHWAARSDHLEVLYALLMKPDADVFAKNDAGKLPLSLALDNPKHAAAIAEIVKRIRTAMEKSKSIRHLHSIYMARYKDGATLLHYAAGYGDAEVVNWFFSQTRTATVRKKDG